MTSQLVAVLALLSLGSVAGLIGGVVFLVKKSWAQALSFYAVPFAAGVLLSVSLLHLLPEAVAEVGQAGYVIVLAALLFSFFFEQFFASLHHHEHRAGTMLKTSVPLVILGDTIHNFIDGTAITAAYLTNPYFGLVVTLATFLHETPHEIGDFGVLMASGWSRGRTFLANFFSALATFPGGLFVFYIIQDAHDKIAVLLAISAGVFLYLGASDFLPEVGEEEKGIFAWKKFSLLLLGVVIMYLLLLVSPEH